MQNEMDVAVIVVKEEEGWEPRLHEVGDPPVDHIGYGCNTEVELTDEEWDIIGRDFDFETDELSEEKGEAWLRYRLNRAMQNAEKGLPNVWDTLNEHRKACVASWVYQNGYAGVFGRKGFKKAVLAIKNGDWEEAAYQMLDSKWAKTDSPARAKRHADCIRLGTFIASDYPGLESNQPTAATPPEADEATQSILASLDALPNEVQGQMNDIWRKAFNDAFVLVIKEWNKQGNDNEEEA